MKKPATPAEPPPELLTIGALAKRVGFAVSALRYYEEVRLTAASAVPVAPPPTAPS